MPNDKFSSYSTVSTSPLESAFDVTPNDSTDLAWVTRAVMVTVTVTVTVAGDVAVTMRDGFDVTIPGLQVGTVYPFRVSRIKATGTTATFGTFTVTGLIPVCTARSG